MLQNKLLLEAYAERPNCYEFFEKKYDLLNREMDSLPFRDDIYFSLKKELSFKSKVKLSVINGILCYCKKVTRINDKIKISDG